MKQYVLGMKIKSRGERKLIKGHGITYILEVYLLLFEFFNLLKISFV